MNQRCQDSIPEDRNGQNHEKKILDKATFKLKEIDEDQTQRHPSPNNQEI